jgi:hypothetical protein
MSATVEIRLIGNNLANTMREMRMWLDHRKFVPQGFRQSTCPGGLALHVEFRGQSEAADFADRFGGRLLGTPPSQAGSAAQGLQKP